MGFKKIEEFVVRRENVARRLATLQLIIEREEIEVKLVSTGMEQETYSVQIRKEDFETLLQAQIDNLTSELTEIDVLLDKWTTEISK